MFIHINSYASWAPIVCLSYISCIFLIFRETYYFPSSYCWDNGIQGCINGTCKCQSSCEAPVFLHNNELPSSEVNSAWVRRRCVTACGIQGWSLGYVFGVSLEWLRDAGQQCYLLPGSLLPTHQTGLWLRNSQTDKNLDYFHRLTECKTSHHTPHWYIVICTILATRKFSLYLAKVLLTSMQKHFLVCFSPSVEKRMTSTTHNIIPSQVWALKLKFSIFIWRKFNSK